MKILLLYLMLTSFKRMQLSFIIDMIVIHASLARDESTTMFSTIWTRHSIAWKKYFTTYTIVPK